jgi:hypothetical protein
MLPLATSFVSDGNLSGSIEWEYKRSLTTLGLERGFGTRLAMLLLSLRIG